MSDARTYEAGGQQFVLTHGTIAYKEEGDELSRRISVAMVFTQHRGYLLIWLFAAPHDAELRELMNARMGFDNDPASKDALLNRNAGGGAPPDGKQPPAAPSANASQAANQSDTGTASAASAPASASATAATSATNSGSQAYAPPSLLRDGEAMQGQSVPNKKPN